MNDIITDIDPHAWLFADEYVYYCEIEDTEDTVKHQEDIDLGMRFSNQSNAISCRLQKKKKKKKKTDTDIDAFYNLEGTVLDTVETLRYLGVTITNDLK